MLLGITCFPSFVIRVKRAAEKIKIPTLLKNPETIAAEKVFANRAAGVKSDISEKK